MKSWRGYSSNPTVTINNGLLGQFIPEADVPNYCCIKYIDKWGNTIFNRLQMDDFIREIKIITEKSKDDKVKALVDHIINLSEKCKNEVHTYIKFIGD
jgi:hypothetical protein